MALFSVAGITDLGLNKYQAVIVAAQHAVGRVEELDSLVLGIVEGAAI